MLRILHLHTFHADFQTRSAIDALRSDATGSARVEVRSIGRGGEYPLPVLAGLSLRRSRADRFDIIHAWGPTALRIVSMTRNEPIVYSPSSDPDLNEVKWTRSIALHRELQIICPTDTVRRRFVENGVAIERCHLIRPGVALAKAKRRRNDALRAELGFAPTDRVTLAPGESTRQSAHEDALYAMTLLNVLDRKNRLLTWGEGPHAEPLRRFAKKLKQPTLVDAQHTLVRAVGFEALLGVADEVLITANAPIPTLPICICMAAGLPIVATVSLTIAELLEDRHTALLVGQRKPRIIAQRILDLREDSRMQWSISDMAHTEAYEFFSMSRFLEQHRAVYQQIVEGKPIEIPQQAPGAGLRFHGRV